LLFFQLWIVPLLIWALSFHVVLQLLNLPFRLVLLQINYLHPLHFHFDSYFPPWLIPLSLFSSLIFFFSSSDLPIFLLPFLTYLTSFLHMFVLSQKLTHLTPSLKKNPHFFMLVSRLFPPFLLDAQQQTLYLDNHHLWS